MVDKTYLEKYLVENHERQLITQAFCSSVAENEIQSSTHFVQAFFVVDEPAFWSIDIRVGTVNWISLNAFEIESNKYPSGNTISMNSIPIRGSHALTQLSGRRQQTKTFEDTGLEIRKLLSFKIIDRR